MDKKEKKKKYMEEWEKKNPEKRAKIQKRKYDKNPKKAMQYTKDWHLNNPEYRSNYYKNYNLIEGNRIKARIRTLTWHKYGSAKICSICNSTNDVEHHHLKPYEVDNFIDLCNKCHEKLHHGEKNK